MIIKRAVLLMVVIGCAPKVEEPIVKEQPPVRLPPKATLDEVIEVCLKRNSEIKAKLAEVEALRQRIPQARALPDPRLGVNLWFEFPRSAVIGKTWKIMQVFPWFGKRRLRAEAMQQRMLQSMQELDLLRLTIKAEMKKAYYRYWEIERTIDVVKGSKELLTASARIAASQYAVGKASQQDVLKANVEISQIENRLRTLRKNLGVVRAYINTLLSRDVNSALPEPPEPQLPPSSRRWRNSTK